MKYPPLQLVKVRVLHKEGGGNAWIKGCVTRLPYFMFIVCHAFLVRVMAPD